MTLLRACLAFRISHSFFLSELRNLCPVDPLQNPGVSGGAGWDRFDSNRTMKRTWSNYFRSGVYLSPLLFTLFPPSPSPSPPSHFTAGTMTLVNLKGFECLVNDFMNNRGRESTLERRRGRDGVRGKWGERGRNWERERKREREGQRADIKIPRVV